MSDSFLPFQDPASVDRKLDSESLTVSGQLVERERVQIGGQTDVSIAQVLNTAPPASSYGLLTKMMGAYSETGAPLFNPTNNSFQVEIVNDLAGSLVVSDVGTIAGGQANIAATVAFPYSWDGSNWERVTRLQPAIVHNNHQAVCTVNGYNVTTSSSVALAANAARKGMMFSNISDTRIYLSFSATPTAAAGAEVGIPVEANGGQVAFSSLIDTRDVNCIHGGTGNKRLLVAEW